ncbi:hypothetical protein CONPUDRAFT_75599 [Coniophora puteana RWD-64-598 SS2]|uniref:Uncharacterized protein n=1 Tax=Coniophora puteana (strain RWD-64-598) TaxID=741705 RepID=A0A5M3MEZ7_CONPW|nr:uncharacterized protein CONPUDRAFT_75599 [Coniophora puteana RWD-64-598 SS2]EIW77808.1 hypothetical protein CONPUDRAFT_75599 [Coniophora puteana RWD-64-598 SS2]
MYLSLFTCLLCPSDIIFSSALRFALFLPQVLDKETLLHLKAIYSPTFLSHLPVSARESLVGHMTIENGFGLTEEESNLTKDMSSSTTMHVKDTEADDLLTFPSAFQPRHQLSTSSSCLNLQLNDGNEEEEEEEGTNSLELENSTFWKFVDVIVVKLHEDCCQCAGNDDNSYKRELQQAFFNIYYLNLTEYLDVELFFQNQNACALDSRLMIINKSLAS